MGTHHWPLKTGCAPLSASECVSLLSRGQAMPLLDHFRPPLSERRHWHSFHNSWATYLSSQINLCLPTGYFAEANVQFGIEIDVAVARDGEPVGSAPTTYEPPAAGVSFP